MFLLFSFFLFTNTKNGFLYIKKNTVLVSQKWKRLYWGMEEATPNYTIENLSCSRRYSHRKPELLSSYWISMHCSLIYSISKFKVFSCPLSMWIVTVQSSLVVALFDVITHQCAEEFDACNSLNDSLKCPKQPRSSFVWCATVIVTDRR